MVFLPGDHTLDMSITVANISRLTMCGESSSGYVATVVCNGSVGLSFTSMVDFKIHSLDFTSCGRSFDKHALSFGKYTLLLESIEYAELVNCTFHDNLGTALAAYHSSITLAGNNEFKNNHWDYEGYNSCVGAAIIAFDNTSLNFIGTSNFINNSADCGGAIYARDNTSLNLTGTSSFNHNSAHYSYGGAIAAGYNTSLSFNGNSNFINNSAHHGGAIYACDNTSLNLTGTSNFINNSAEGGGAIFARSNTSLNLTGTSSFTNNSAGVFGGAIAALYNTSLSFTGTSDFISNSAEGGGGVIHAGDNASLSFTGTSNFINNSAEWGGAIFARFNTSLNLTGTSSFTNNSAGVFGGAIAALYNTALSSTGTSNFISNSAFRGGAIHAGDNTSLNLTGTSSFTNNSADYGGAIAASYNTALNFTGNSNFINNSADDGGGVFLLNSTLSISNTIVYWESNHARSGGAIYFQVSFYCTLDAHTCTTKGECFFQLPGQNLSNGIDAQFVFKDNSADAGSVLYGGAIDNCKLTGLESSSSVEVFDMLVHIENDNTNPSISSDPFRICPCENNLPDCSKSDKSYTVHPGETFHISVVAVGQRNGIIPSNVRGRLLNFQQDLIIGTPNSMSSTPIGNLHHLQYLQATFNTCTTLNYTTFSLLDTVFLKLNADNPCATFSNALYVRMDVNQTCPPGFYLSKIERSCVCNQRLAKYTDRCDITDGIGRITHSSHDHFWVGYDNESDALILHPHCPFDYCVSHTVDFPLNNTDLQCAYNRSGLLCGACKKGYSLVLGTSQCKQCTNIHLVLLIPFALMGLALVFFLLVSKLTVATGTLSGLVFYANIFAINRNIFLPMKSTKSDALSIFIAWLNLDFGVETCFYDGMDAYSKAWLKFVFPVYIWVLVGLMIFVSHFSRRFAKLLGNNPVSVLATLIFLSYTKILSVFNVTYLNYPTYTREVWLYDANIDYLSAKHLPLFLFALLVFLVFLLPYTLLLFFGQWLQALSHRRLFVWVNSARIKPFIDSYHAPYKARHRYWPGLMLALRFVLLLIFALNTQQDPDINLLAILIGTGTLQLWAWTSGGVYKNSYLDALEGSFALNLIILVGSTMFVNHDGGNQLAVGYTSVTIALVTFIGILAFQLADVTGVVQCIKRKYIDLKRHRMSNRHLEVEVESESDTDSLPDRLINPNQYELLPHTAQKHRVAEPAESNEAVNEEPRRVITVDTYSSMK